MCKLKFGRWNKRLVPFWVGTELPSTSVFGLASAETNADEPNIVYPLICQYTR